MSDPEFSTQKSREILESRLGKTQKRPAMADRPPVYWDFFSAHSSPMRNLNKLQILAMSDEEIEEAYARWRIES